jgi:hypothetical protein
MAFRILALFAVLAVSLRADNPHWSFLPVNSVLPGGEVSSGLMFYFTDPPYRGGINIVAKVLDCGTESTINGDLSTDDPLPQLLKFPVKSLDGFRVLGLTMNFRNRTLDIPHPDPAQNYGY